MTQIERIRKAKSLPGLVLWFWYVVAQVYLVTLVFDLISSKVGLAALHASCFAVFMLCYYATAQARLNKELVSEIDRLRKIIEPEEGLDQAA